MPGLTEDKSGCMILYALKFIQFVVREINKKRITVVQARENERNSKFVGSISGQEGAQLKCLMCASMESVSSNRYVLVRPLVLSWLLCDT